MNGYSPFEGVMTSLPFDNTSNTAEIDLPTPTSSTSPQPLDNAENLPYDQLLLEYHSLQSSNKTLHLNLATQEAQNAYWMRVFTYVEKGLALKIAELDTLKGENQQFKVTLSI